MDQQKRMKISEHTSVEIINISKLKEQDRNARILEKEKMEIMAENIKDEGALESYPLVYKDGDDYRIISGHHRVRASKMAGMKEVPCIVLERKLTQSEVRQKQLAHNALSGHDDPVILNELYNEIEDLNLRVRTGLDEEEVKLDEKATSLFDIDYEFDYEIVELLFIKNTYDKFEQLVEELGGADKYFVVDKKEFSKFSKVIDGVAVEFDVRNITSAMSLMIKLAKERLEEIREEKEDGKL